MPVCSRADSTRSSRRRWRSRRTFPPRSSRYPLRGSWPTLCLHGAGLPSGSTPLSVRPNDAPPQSVAPPAAAAGPQATHNGVGQVSYLTDGSVPCPAPPQTVYPSLPPDAFTGGPQDGYTRPGLPGDCSAAPDSCCPRSGWRPPGIPGPWPLDEYICDGGDRYVLTEVADDYRVRGLDMEDTIVHYDTVDGRRLVEPSNRVCIYAPRFAAVRQITSPLQHDQQDRIGRFDQPEQLFRADDLQIATTAIQPLQPIGEVGTKRVTTFQQELRGQSVDAGQALHEFQFGFMPYENLGIIKTGHVEQADKARLAQGIDAALAWTHNQAVQILIDRQPAHELGGDSKPQTTLRFEMPPGKPRVRICKVASKQNALPGETVDFTLRFDNVGDQPVGNVTVIDNLTPRLEYLPDTAQCSLDAEFSTEDNEGESLVLRWEILEPIEVGEGGIIRFQCRVR